MNKIIMATLVDEIDNIFYILVAVLLILAVMIFKPDAATLGMVMILFGVLMAKIRGGEAIGKVAGTLKGIIKK